MKFYRLALTAVTALSFLFIISFPAFSGNWYKGDLHSHSTHSDGDSPVAAVIQSAELKGLDFFCITDHDTSMLGSPVHWYDTDYLSEKMVLLYGIEWTSVKGHANIWATEPFVYEELWYANMNRDPETAIAEAHSQGALFSINHPLAFAGYAMGWDYDVVEGVDAIEVWNNMFNLPMFNFLAVRVFWDGLLQKGMRIPGVGGSDNHHLFKLFSFFYGIGNPSTWVYAQELSAEAILDGIKAGNVSISYSPVAPRLDFSADENGDGIFQTIMGQSIFSTSYPVSFKIELCYETQPESKSHNRVYEIQGFSDNKLYQLLETLNLLSTSGFKPYIALVLKDGNVFRAWLVTEGAESIIFQDTPSAPGYYRVELYGMPDVKPFQYPFYGNMIALTNPIYIE